MRQQASGIRGSAGPSRTLSQRAIDRVRRVLAARRQHTENAELAAAIKFTQEGKRRRYTVEDGGATRQAGTRCVVASPLQRLVRILLPPVQSGRCMWLFWQLTREKCLIPKCSEIRGNSSDISKGIFQIDI